MGLLPLHLAALWSTALPLPGSTDGAVHPVGSDGALPDLRLGEPEERKLMERLGLEGVRIRRMACYRNYNPDTLGAQKQ